MAKINETELTLHDNSNFQTVADESKFDALVKKGSIKILGNYDPWLHAAKAIKFAEMFNKDG